MKAWKIILLTVLALSIVGSSAAYVLLRTSYGAQWAVRQGASRYVEYGRFDFEELKGNLTEGIELKNVRLTDLKDVPKGALVDIQRLFVRLTSLSRDGLEVHLENARIKLPTAEPVIITGHLKQGKVDANVYTRAVILQDIMPLIPQIPREVSGTLTGVDLYISGPVTELDVKGAVMVETLKLRVKGFTLKSVPLAVNLGIKKDDPAGMLFGSLYTDEGVLLSKRTKVNLKESRLMFDGDIRNPHLDLQGDCVVEKVKIHLAVRGTRRTPDLTLTSDPPLPKEALLVMVATGKSWQGVQKSVDENVISPELAEDFIDYFLFAGRGQKIAEKLGITDISVSFDENQKGVEVKKSISENLQLDYGIEQTVDERQQTQFKQKVGGELQVTEKILIGAEKEIVPQATPDPAATTTEPSTTETIPTDERVYFKYKTKF